MLTLSITRLSFSTVAALEGSLEEKTSGKR